MKGTVLLTVWNPLGGIRTYFKYVYKKKYIEDYQLTFIITKDESNKYFLEFAKEIDAEVIILDKKYFKFITHIFITAFRKKFDIIHSHGFTSSVLSLPAAKIFNIQHILTSHDVILDRHFRGLKGKIRKYIMTLCMNNIDIIQSVSNDAEMNIKKYLYGVNKCQFITIRNGIDVGVYINKQKRDFERELKIGDEYLKIGFLGRFMEQKGFRYLVDAVSILSTDKALGKTPVVLCFGEGDYIREDKKYINKLDLNDYFIFMPAVSNVASTIKGLDVVVMPSLWEAGPLLAMETLVLGTPLVATECVGLREMIEGTPAIRIKKRNAESISEALRLIINKQDINKLFMDYRDIAINKYDSSIVSRKLFRLYDDIRKSHVTE